MPFILLSHRRNTSSSAEDNRLPLFSTLSSGFICKVFFNLGEVHSLINKKLFRTT